MEFSPTAPPPSPGDGWPTTALVAAPATAPAPAAGGGTRGSPPRDITERAWVTGTEETATAPATLGSTGALFGAILEDEDEELDKELDDDDATPRRTASAPTWRAKCRACEHGHRECHTPPICSVWARGFFGKLHLFTNTEILPRFRPRTRVTPYFLPVCMYVDERSSYKVLALDSLYSCLNSPSS